MATVKSLEDMLSSEVDESAVTALVGSLESQLASSSIQLSSQDVSATSVTVNHVNNNVTRLLDGPKQAVSLVSVGKPNSDRATPTSGVIATLPGALPASGYITQVTLPSQQNFFSPVNRSTNNQEIKVVYTSQSVVVSSAASTISTRSKAAAAGTLSNGNSLGLIVRTSQAAPLGAIYDLATVASQQSPIVTATTTAAMPPAVTNGKLTTQADPKSSEPKTAKPVVQTTLLGTNVLQSTTKGGTTLMTTPGLLGPGVQIVNVGPRGLGPQKSLAPRVMLATNPVRIAAAPQLLTARGQVAGQGTITLSPGMVRGAVLLKAENGQLQVVNIAQHPSQHPTYRLQPLPNTAGATNVRAVTPQQIVTVPVSAATLKASQASVTVPQTLVGTLLQSGTTAVNVVNSRLSSPVANKTATLKAGVNGNLGSPLTVNTTTSNSQPSTPTQMSPNTAKKKCKNFLSTLIRLADEQPAQVARSVRNLIQGIIDGTMQAEEFTAKLQKELNSAPQPYLVPFLKKNLPYLRYSLVTKELTIEGVRPPPPGALSLPHPSSVQTPQTIPKVRPTLGAPTTPQVRLLATTTPTHCIIQQHRFTQPRPGTKSILLGGKGVAASSPATLGALQAKPRETPKRNFSTLREDDDLNDVAAMGGVNLLEESQRILGPGAELVGREIRSCSDEGSLLLPQNLLHARLRTCAIKHGLEEVSPEVARLISHASQERLRGLVERLSLIAEHRMEVTKADPHYEISHDVRGQVKFLEELDRLERRRHDDRQRELLLRAAKSRSKLEDPEQLKLKQKAKEMQRAELEELRQREANTTALLAIGPRKKAPRLDGQANPNAQFSGGNTYAGGTAKMQMRPRVKRVNMRDLLYLMEQERETIRRPLLYKSYLK